MASTAFGSALWFLAILVTIPVALWLFKRSPAGARFAGAAAGGGLRQVATLPLSPSQRIVTVEVGDGESRRWLVLGVTPQSIRTLHTLEPAADAPPPVAPALPGFAQVLDRLRGEKKDRA